MSEEVHRPLIKGPKTLSIMPTFTCPASCSQCGTYSNPQDKNHITLDTIIESINQAKKLNFANIVFTGGEATLRWNDLIEGIKHATNLGFPVRLVTNGHWAINPEIASTKLTALVNAGLTEINFSTGDEHLKYIKIEKIVNGIIAAFNSPITTCLMIELKTNRNFTKAHILQSLREKGLSEDKINSLKIVESPWMPLDPSTIEEYPNGIAANQKNVNSRTGCESILQTYVIQGDGRVASCCGLGMRGIEELNVSKVNNEDFLFEAIKASENDFFKVWLHYVGPEKILKWAASFDQSIEWENMYAHRCQACIRIYKDAKIKDIIIKKHKEVMPAILQTIWLQEKYIPAKALSINQNNIENFV